MSRHNYRGRGFEALLQSVERYAASEDRPQLSRSATAGSGSLLGDEPGNRQVAAWFLGPRSENGALFEQMITEALRDHLFWRRNFHPEDPPAITERTKRDEGYLDSIDTMSTEFDRLLASLKMSAPFFSARYQGHMIWEQTMPGMAGYFAGMLYNQNNVALEASPVTSVLEVEVAKDLCAMCGYGSDPAKPKPWGHLTCGGSTANIEALWAARNLMFYPISLRKALNDPTSPLADAKGLTITLPSGKQGGRLVDLSTWQLLNLGIDEILSLTARIDRDFGISPDTVTAAVSQHLLQNMGFPKFARKFLIDVPEPAIIVPGSAHYSFPKGAAILGLGADQVHLAPLDIHGRMDVKWVRDQIKAFVKEQRPVITVAGILGTTEESSVDDLEELLDMRDEFRKEHETEYAIHADAAWGGYFASLLWDSLDQAPALSATCEGPAPVLPMSIYTTRQYKNLYRADTITLDPHKTGYLPYPAGALVYRNGAMRSLISFEAPYVNPDAGDNELVIGSYGIEGSKPGAAAAGVYLSHAVIRPTRAGYGRILGRTLYNTKLFHLKLLGMNDPSESFTVVPVPYINMKEGALAKYTNEKEALDAIHSFIDNKSHKQIWSDDDALEHLRELGADLNILTYAFNYRQNGVLNQDLAAANAFNKRLYQQLGVKFDGRQIQDYDVIVSTTDFKKETYGETFFNDYKRRLLSLASAPNNKDEKFITVMRSVIMDPWLAEDAGGKPFIDTVIEELRAVLHRTLKEMAAEQSPGVPLN